MTDFFGPKGESVFIPIVGAPTNSVLEFAAAVQGHLDELVGMHRQFGRMPDWSLVRSLQGALHPRTVRAMLEWDAAKSTGFNFYLIDRTTPWEVQFNWFYDKELQRLIWEVESCGFRVSDNKAIRDSART